MIKNRLLAGSISLMLMAGFAPYLGQDASALNLAWSGAGTSGADPLGHTWLVTNGGWGTPGIGEGQLNFLGSDWVDDFHFTVNSLPSGCEIDPAGNTQFRVGPVPTIPWDMTIIGNTIWFEAAVPADRLDPGELFFVNVSFTCDITTIDFDAEWSMSQVVGGEFLSIDSTALMLAGLQSSAIWMLPVLAGATGISAFYIKTRMNKE